MIDQNMVRHLARLGKLKLTNAEVTKFAAQMDDIVKLMDTIQEVQLKEDAETERREQLPFHRMPEGCPDDRNGPDDPDSRDALLLNAKGRQDGFYTVPKVVKGS